MKTMNRKTNGKANAFMESVLCLPMAALLLASALAGPASGGTLAPFSGVIAGTEDFDFAHPSGIDIKILGSGGGNASHLGRFTATWDADITLANLDQPIKRTFVAANGDELYAEGFGAGTPPPDQFVTEDMSITGGTGLFEFATGSFTLERTVFDVGNPGFTDLETVGSFDGFISTVGSTGGRHVPSAHAVPEPASMSLALVCLLGLVTCVRRRTKCR